MANQRLRSSVARIARALFGSVVVLLTVPTGIGPVLGGWLAGRGTDRPARGLPTSAAAGLLGALPWAVVVFLAARGAIEPIGYHDGLVHVGVMTAAPETFVLWQELGLTVLFVETVTAMAVAGGVLAALSNSVLETLRGDVPTEDTWSG